MTEKPLANLYLDVDCVLNAQSPQGWGKVENGWAVAEGRRYKIRWAPALIEELAALPVNLVWTTTWRDDATRSLSDLLGWGHHGRVLHPNMDPDAETTFPSIYWKMDAVEMDQLANPVPYIHIDDEFYGADAHGEDYLVIGPNPSTGITPKHVQMIKDFLEGLKTDE